MCFELIISKSINISSAPSVVWDVLVNPETIAQYFTGAEAVTDWKIGGEIIFNHNYDGKEFTNKGTILNFQPNYLLKYTYWTIFSNTEDKPENYTTITYTLTEVNNKTKLDLTQTNLKSVEWFQGLKIGWDAVLTRIKELAEENNDC